MSIPFFYPTQKAALVWPDTGVHGKAAPVGIAGSTHLGSSLSNSGAGGGGRVSPGSGLVHWVSMMTDHGHGHMPSPAHTGSSHGDAVHYSMWTNGSLEVSVDHRLPFRSCSSLWDFPPLFLRSLFLESTSPRQPFITTNG